MKRNFLITKNGPIIGTIVEGADHPDPDDYDVIEIKRRKVKDKEDEDEYRLVVYSILTTKSKDYYDKLVNELYKTPNKWFSKNECLRKISDSSKEIQTMKNISWYWHTDSKKYKIVNNENAKGLIMKLEKNIWLMRYNL